MEVTESGVYVENKVNANADKHNIVFSRADWWQDRGGLYHSESGGKGVNKQCVITCTGHYGWSIPAQDCGSLSTWPQLWPQHVYICAQWQHPTPCDIPHTMLCHIHGERQWQHPTPCNMDTPCCVRTMDIDLDDWNIMISRPIVNNDPGDWCIMTPRPITNNDLGDWHIMTTRSMVNSDKRLPYHDDIQANS